jgi:hypothetical protein
MGYQMGFCALVRPQDATQQIQVPPPDGRIIYVSCARRSLGGSSNCVPCIRFRDISANVSSDDHHRLYKGRILAFSSFLGRNVRLGKGCTVASGKES